MDRKDTQGRNGADGEMSALSLYVLVCERAVIECTCKHAERERESVRVKVSSKWVFRD